VLPQPTWQPEPVQNSAAKEAPVQKLVVDTPAANATGPNSSASRSAASKSAASKSAESAAADAATSAAADNSRPAAGGEKPKPAASRRGGKRPAELTVALTWHDGQWTVQATRGARTVAKASPVRAADALRMVGMLESPAVHEVVAEIVESARADATEQAERLRQQLAEVEAALADLEDLS
jgi:hypothetical protein